MYYNFDLQKGDSFHFKNEEKFMVLVIERSWRAKTKP